MMLTVNPFLHMRRLLFIVALLSGLVAGKTLAAEARAADTVEQFHNTLLEVMRNSDSLGFGGRYDTLKPVIENSFDTPLIARVIMGRYWEGLSTEQKQQFINTFNELSIATYASRFNSYDGESFEHLTTEPLNKQRVLVQTRMIKPDGDNVKFDYLMHQRDGEWYIMSVVAQGVNDLSMKRAEYSSIMEEKSFSGLIDELHSKIAALRPSQ